MKQKVSGPVAIVIAVVAAVIICGLLYWKFMYKPTYSVQDVAAKYKAAGAKMQGPPNMRGK